MKNLNLLCTECDNIKKSDENSNSMSGTGCTLANTLYNAERQFRDIWTQKMHIFRACMMVITIFLSQCF